MASNVNKRYPILPPEVLLDAHHETVHKDRGPARPAVSQKLPGPVTRETPWEDWLVHWDFYDRVCFKDLQQMMLKYAVYPGFNEGNYWYPALGLSGEAGEVAEKIKKVYRDQDGIVSEENRIAILKELGDVLWYICAMANELQSDLSVVAEMAVEKLESRQKRGTLTGSGDDR